MPQLYSDKGNAFWPAAGPPQQKLGYPCKTREGQRSLWKTLLCVCSAISIGPDAAETSPAKRASGKETREQTKICKSSVGSGVWTALRGKQVRGWECSQRGAHGSRNSRQKKPGWFSCLCLARPLFFQKLRVKTIAF